MPDHSVRLTPGISWRLATFIAATHAVTLAGLTASACPWPLEPMLTAIVLYSAYHYLSVHALRTAKRSVIEVVLREDHATTVRTRAGLAAARLLPGAFVHPALVVLGFETDSGARLVFCSTAADLGAESFSRLCWLLERATPAHGTPHRRSGHGSRRC